MRGHKQDAGEQPSSVDSPSGLWEILGYRKSENGVIWMPFSMDPSSYSPGTRTVGGESRNTSRVLRVTCEYTHVQIQR